MNSSGSDDTGVTPARDAAFARNSAAAGNDSPPWWCHWAIAAGLIAFTLRLLHVPVADLDMFHEMALIREALADGFLATQDVYAYTPTVDRVIHHEWGTGAVLYLVAVASGWGGAGIIALRFLLLAGIAACCYWVARVRDAPLSMLAVLAPLAIAMLAVGMSPVRAQLFTFLFVGCLLVFLELDRRGTRWWLALWLPLYVIWLNMHGGFVVGAGLFLLYALERFVRMVVATSSISAALLRTSHLAAAGVAMLFLPLVNPYGAEYVTYLWHALRLDRPRVMEWAPIWDGNTAVQHVLIYLLSWLFLLYAIARAGRPQKLSGLLLVVTVAVLAANTRRLFPIYGIIWLSYVPAYLAGTDFNAMIERGWRRFGVPVAAGVLLIAAALFASAVQLRFWELRVPSSGTQRQIYFPVGPVDYLSAHGFSGNLMTPFNAGAFVSWHLYPAVRVGMDSRYEVAYPAATSADEERLYDGDPQWAEILDRYPTDAVLVPLTSPLHALLSSEGRTPQSAWHRVYQDDGYTIFARNGVAGRLPVVDRTGELIVGRFP